MISQILCTNPGKRKCREVNQVRVSCLLLYAGVRKNKSRKEGCTFGYSVECYLDEDMINISNAYGHTPSWRVMLNTYNGADNFLLCIWQHC